MILQRKLALLLIAFVIGGCSTAPKQAVNLDTSLTNRIELNRLCAEKAMGACALLGQAAAPQQPLPVMQSVTSAEQARFVVQAPEESSLHYYVVGWGGVKKLDAKSIRHPGFQQRIDQVEALGLKTGEYYELVIVDQNARLWDRRKFKALDLKKKKARLALVSCLDDHFEEQQKVMWPALLEDKPDVILMIGDNVYADWSDGKRTPVSDAAQLWRRYSETRSRLDLFKADPLVPVFATWDDHDYGKNDSDRTWALKDAATSTFFAFFDQQRPAPGFERGPGVASWWRAFGVQIALLDDRSFRSPNGEDLPDQTHFGVDQELWLKEGLAAASVPVLLASGDQFFGGYHKFESFERNHNRNFKSQLARWRKVSANPIVFLSGDRHLTEINKVPKEHLGYPTFEITSSGIHSKTFPDQYKSDPNPTMLVGKAGEYNYTVFEIVSATAKSLELDVKSFGLNKAVLYQQTLTVKRE
jgi:hypothetical protein